MNTLKALLKRVPYLVKVVRGVRYWSYVRRLHGPDIMRLFAQLFPHAIFVQVGSNDGDQLDHLQKAILSHDWHGVMVEPVPYVFGRLKANYGHLQSRVALRNIAIGPVEGATPFWHLRQDDTDEDLPRWYDALGSFRKDIVLWHERFIPDIKDRLTCTEVNTQTFSGLCEREKIQQIDLVQMDTEGFDYEIIKLIDFERYRPRLLIYEHLHLDETTRRECEQRLLAAGYVLLREGMDTWCLDARDRDERQGRLLAHWRKRVGRDELVGSGLTHDA